MNIEEFKKYWEEAYEHPFKPIKLPTGARMYSNRQDVFVMFEETGKLKPTMQAITSDREWYGCTWEIENYDETSNPEKWVIQPSGYCKI